MVVCTVDRMNCQSTFRKKLARRKLGRTRGVTWSQNAYLSEFTNEEYEPDVSHEGRLKGREWCSAIPPIRVKNVF